MYTKDWDEWKHTLANAIDLGETIGMSDKAITDTAEKVGTYLSKNVEPRNPEERLLKEMWDVADKGDRSVLAKIVVKMTDK